MTRGVEVEAPAVPVPVASAAGPGGPGPGPGPGRLVVSDDGGAVVHVTAYNGEAELRIEATRPTLLRYALAFLDAGLRRGAGTDSADAEKPPGLSAPAVSGVEPT